jgi:hypothetical protein
MSTLAVSNLKHESASGNNIVLASDGKVGIGTASPAVAMDVVGQVRASTGILFGSDTAAANALDDYEEGDWTPVFGGSGSDPTSVSYITQTGKYTKIGRFVIAQFAVTISTGYTQGSGVIRLRGLPFAALITAHSGNFMVERTSSTMIDRHCAPYTAANQTYISFSSGQSGSGWSDLLISDISTAVTTYLWGSVTYTVA